MSRSIILIIFVLISGCKKSEESFFCITALDCPQGEICVNGACITDPGYSGDTGNTADSGDTVDTGDTADTGDTTDTGDTSDSADSGNTTEPDSSDTGDDTEDAENDKDFISDEDTADADTYAADGDTADSSFTDDDVYVPECGNGITDEGEACDDGEFNGTAGKCKADCSGYPCVPAAVNFEYTGAEQTWTVPAGITTVTIEVWGAQGGGYTTPGGLGGYAKGDRTVTPGEILHIFVGGQGSSSGASAIVNGGFNGGGYSYGFDGNAYGASGGGATDVRAGGTDLLNRVIVAGGGGGSSYYNGATAGGAGGGDSGGTGAPCPAFPEYYTGGGGSGYVGGVTNSSMSSGTRSGNGLATITTLCP